MKAWKEIVLTGILLVACAGGLKQDVKDVTAATSLICDVLALQDESDWVQYGCDVVDVAGKVETRVLAKVSTQDAPKFTALHVRR